MEKSDCGWERSQNHGLKIGGGSEKGLARGPFKDEVEVDYGALESRISMCPIA